MRANKLIVRSGTNSPTPALNLYHALIKWNLIPYETIRKHFVIYSLELYSSSHFIVCTCLKLLISHIYWSVSRYSDWLQAGRPRGRSSSPGSGKNFFFPTSFRPCSGAHSASYPMGIGGSFPWGKATRAWSWPLISYSCRGQENVDLHPHSPIRRHGVVLN
jgi:hypothetical protein